MNVPVDQPWDSAILGFDVGRVRVTDGAETSIRSGGNRLVYIDSSIPLRADEQLKFIGELTTLTCVAPADAGSTSCVELDEEALAIAARVAFGGRYERDARLGQAIAAKVYRQWVIDASTDPDRSVLGASGGLGLIVLRSQPEFRIELIGVDPAARGQGVGRQLVGCAKAFAARSAASISVGGYADNEVAMGLYSSNGFTPSRRTWSYHWWPRSEKDLLRTNAS